MDTKPEKGCGICKLLKANEDELVVTTSQHRRVALHDDQFYLGRAYVTSLEYFSSLSAISDAAWLDLHQVIREYETACREQLGAVHVTGLAS